jgi:hypothetical protein
MKKILFLSLVFVLLVSGCSRNKITVISLEDAKAKALSFINNNLVQAGQEVKLKTATEENGLYKIVITMASGQEVTTYITKDGGKFFPQVMDIAETEKKIADQKASSTPETASTAPKTAKPKVDLFVMGFCPYGVIAEQAMAPVYDLLKAKADININYIVSDATDNINDVKSLHGTTEGFEDARQLCIAKNYNKDILWKYVNEIDEKCYPIYRQGDDAYKTCWQTAAKNAGVNVSKIETCVTKEGASLVKAQDAGAQAASVSGSPTLIINGAKVNADRTPEGYKTAICAAFDTAPTECNKTLSTDGAAATGGCQQ